MPQADQDRAPTGHQPSADLMALADLAEAAGRAILEIRARGCDTLHKGDGSPVTEADLAADRIIQAGLAQLWSKVPVISEETVACALPSPPAPFVLVDPLDGTQDFVAGRDGFTVNIALIGADSRPLLGVVSVPVTGATYVGHVGDGAWRRQSPTGPWEKIQARPAPQDPVAVASLSNLDPATQNWLAANKITRTVQVSSSLKFCQIADGSADVYPRFGPTMEWDTAAGDAVAVAAGAIMRTPDGAPFVYGKQAAGFLNGPFILTGRPAELTGA